MLPKMVGDNPKNSAKMIVRWEVKIPNFAERTETEEGSAGEQPFKG